MLLSKTVWIQSSSEEKFLIRPFSTYVSYFNILDTQYWASQTFDLIYHRSASVLAFPDPGTSPNVKFFRDKWHFLSFLTLLLWSFPQRRSLEGLSQDWNRTVEPGVRGIARAKFWRPFQTFGLVSSTAYKLGDAAAAAFWLLRNIPWRGMSCIYPHQSLFYPEPQMCSQTAMNSCGKRQIMVSLHLCKRIWKMQICSDQQQNMLLIPVVQLQNELCPPISPNEHKILLHSTEGILWRKSPPQGNNDLQQDKSPLLLYLYLFQSR